MDYILLTEKRRQYNKHLTELIESHNISELDSYFICQFLFRKADPYTVYSNRVLFNETEENKENQIICNLVMSLTIQKIPEYLSIPDSFFKLRLETMQQFEPTAINSSIMESLCRFETYTPYYELKYFKILYIFVLYCGFQRRLIHYFQNRLQYPTLESFKNILMGKLSDIFTEHSVHYMYHSFNMKRFELYSRAKDNIIAMYKAGQYTVVQKEETLDAFPGKQFIHADCKIFLRIPEFFLRNSKLYSEKDKYIGSTVIYNYIVVLFDENGKIHVEPHHRQKHRYGLGNISLTLEALMRLFDLQAYCLHLLDNEEDFEHIIELNTLLDKKIFTIVLFYYIFILVMPFRTGNAMVAEMILHSLIKKYVSSTVSIILNPQIMLDIEALTLPFIKFYNNCLTSDGTKYTPYFIFKSDTSDLMR